MAPTDSPASKGEVIVREKLQRNFVRGVSDASTALPEDEQCTDGVQGVPSAVVLDGDLRGQPTLPRHSLASIGFERENSTGTSTSKYRDIEQLDMLVKELHGRAESGVQVDLVDAATQQKCRGTFKIDSHCESITLLRVGRAGISFGFGDIVAVLRGSRLARSLPCLGSIAPICVAVQLPSKLSESPLIFRFSTAEAAGDFHACLKVFKIMGNAGKAYQAFLPEADNEEALPLVRQTRREGVCSSWRPPCIETSTELEAI